MSTSTMGEPEALGASAAIAPQVTAAVASPSIYRNLGLWLLMLVSALNFLDRQLANILAEPIKRELHITDTQIGMMTGLAFAVLYTLAGIPFALYSDRPRANRSHLIGLALVVWSVFTAMCGLAGNFAQLIAARIGVGAGEAGCTPPSHSLISDSFPVEKRAPALAFYGLGLPLGTLLGMALGGGLSDAFGWRATFVLLGVPGIVIGLIVWLFVPEPRRLALPGSTLAQRGTPSFAAVMTEIARSPAFLFLMAAMTTGSFLSYGKGVWHAVFLIRSHHVTAGQAGLALGLVGGIGSAFGAWLGGYCAARFGAVRRQHVLSVVVIAQLVQMPFSLLAYYVSDWRAAALLLLAQAVTSGASYGPTFTALQGLVRPSSRGGATAIFLLVQNLVGLGFGPMLFGMLSDHLAPSLGAESVRYVLYLTVPLSLIPAFCFWRSSRHLDREMLE